MTPTRGCRPPPPSEASTRSQCKSLSRVITDRVSNCVSAGELDTRHRRRSVSGSRRSWSRTGRARGETWCTRQLCSDLSSLYLLSYDHYDQETDEQWHKLSMFILVTMPIFMIALWVYQPDRDMRQWATREVR